MICLMSSPEERAQDIFGRRASFYTTSASHADPQVLAKVLALADPKPDWTVLDVATGTGHTAFALSRHVASVIVRPKNAPAPRKILGFFADCAAKKWPFGQPVPRAVCEKAAVSNQRTALS